MGKDVGLEEMVTETGFPAYLAKMITYLAIAFFFVLFFGVKLSDSG